MNKTDKMVEYSIMLALLNQFHNQGYLTEEEYRILSRKFQEEYKGDFQVKER